MKAKNNKGITLIALVVTIVVLIILATISINLVFNENGIIGQAQRAKEFQANGEALDQERIDAYDQHVANALAGKAGSGGDTPKLPEITPTTPAGTEVKKPSTWDSTKVKAISDGSGNVVPLPDGFYYVGGNRTEGLVISDNSKDANKGTAYETASTLEGNQFVWIPVSGEADLVRTKFDTTGQPEDSLDTKYTEPFNYNGSTGYSTEESEYNTMKTQVIKYGGFYIGRYEAGDGTAGTTLRTKVTVDHEVVCKKGVAPYNYVPWGKSMSDVETAFVPTDNNDDNVTTHGAVYLAKNMYIGKEQSQSVASTLCYGCEWDAMCRYIGDSQRTTPTKDAPELTGSVLTDISKNIYDLAGNCYEWTMEAHWADYREARGGNYIDASSVPGRYSSYPYRTSPSVGIRGDYDGYSFRLALYIK